MIITCPHCQTKYQVTYEAIGSAGRKVQCAHCQQAWNQAPLSRPVAPEPPPPPLEDIDEDALDEAIESEARAAAKPAPARKAEDKKPSENEAGKVDPSVIRMRQRAFSRRQDAMVGGMPFARLRRFSRILAFLLLVGAVTGLWFGREDVVRQFPQMAGVYAAMGAGVNVVGLDFSNVTTLRKLKEGKDILIVSAQIVGLNPRPMPVPPVVVTLLDSHGQAVYEWSVAPAVPDLMAAERATFNTQLTLPPGDASQVRLSFAGGQVNGDAAAAAPAEPAPPAEAPTPHAAEPEVADAPAAESAHTPAPEHH